jgi:hypothetical protein
LVCTGAATAACEALTTPGATPGWEAPHFGQNFAPLSILVPQALQKAIKSFSAANDNSTQWFSVGHHHLSGDQHARTSVISANSAISAF